MKQSCECLNKNLTIIVLMILGLAWLAPGSANAEEIQNKIGLGAFLAAHNTGSSDMNDVNANFDTTAIFGVSGVYFINNAFSVVLSATSLSTDMKLEYDGKSGAFGQVQQNPILLIARYQHPIKKTNANIYLGLGAGYFMNSFDHDKRTDLSDFFGVNMASADIKDSYGWLANVGTELFFKKHFSVCLDLKVIFSQAEFDLTHLDGTTEKQDAAMNSSALGIGVNYYF
jgi:outer membrane protein W